MSKKVLQQIPCARASRGNLDAFGDSAGFARPWVSACRQVPVLGTPPSPVRGASEA